MHSESTREEEYLVSFAEASRWHYVWNIWTCTKEGACFLRGLYSEICLHACYHDLGRDSRPFGVGKPARKLQRWHAL